jgi:hypothetical protein
MQGTRLNETMWLNNVIGGVRTPAVNVPVSTLSGTAEGYILSADRASLLAQAMQVQFPA